MSDPMASGLTQFPAISPALPMCVRVLCLLAGSFCIENTQHMPGGHVSEADRREQSKKKKNHLDRDAFSPPTASDREEKKMQ